MFSLCVYIPRGHQPVGVMVGVSSTNAVGVGTGAVVTRAVVVALVVMLINTSFTSLSCRSNLAIGYRDPFRSTLFRQTLWVPHLGFGTGGRG